MKPISIWHPKQSRVHNQLDFNVGDPSLYHCSILRYTRSHLHLTIVAYKQKDSLEPAFYLGFETVWYFQGPTNWTGVDFELSDVNERKVLLQKGFLNVEENMVEIVAQRHQLFVIHKPAFIIQILAANCYVVKDIPNSKSTFW